MFCSILSTDVDVSEVHRRLQALTSSRLDRDQDGGCSPATLYLKSAMGNGTLSEAASHFVRVGALCDWSSLVASEQWDSQRNKKCKRRPPGRTFQTPVQAGANKVSVTLARARGLFLFPFFFPFFRVSCRSGSVSLGKPFFFWLLCIWPCPFQCHSHCASLSVSGFYDEPFTLLYVPLFFFFFATFINQSLSLTAITQSD